MIEGFLIGVVVSSCICWLCTLVIVELHRIEVRKLKEKLRENSLF